MDSFLNNFLFKINLDLILKDKLGETCNDHVI